MACCSASPAVSTPIEKTGSISRFLTENADQRLVFESPDRPVNPGFHVTEVKLAQISSLDCGRARQQWSEIVIQVMDVPGSTDEPLTAGKLARILAESLPANSAGEATFTIELSDGRDTLHLYDVGATYTRGDDFVVQLAARHASCKAAGRSASVTAGRSCCG